MDKLPKIPNISQSGQMKPLTKNQQDMLLSDSLLQNKNQKTVLPRNQQQKKVDVSFQIGNPRVDKIQLQTIPDMNKQLFQKTYSGLEAITTILGQVQALAKMLKNSRVPQHTRAEVQSQIISFINEIDYIAKNAKVNQLSLLENIPTSQMKLQIFENGPFIDVKSFNVLREIADLKNKIKSAPTKSNNEAMIELSEVVSKNIYEYQNYLRNITVNLGLEIDFHILKNVKQSNAPVEIKTMSEQTRTLILAQYGITFMSQMEKQVKSFIVSPLGIILMISLGILIVLFVN